MRFNDEQPQDLSKAENPIKVHELEDRIEELSGSHSAVMKWIASLLG